MFFWSLFLALASAAPVHTGGSSIDVHKELQKYKNVTPYMDIQYRIGDTTETKRVRFELFWKDAPMTTLNFVKLLSEPEPKPAYLNCRFHRIIPTFMMQGGDFTMHDGRGGRSIYGPKFKDEAFIHKHEPGVLSMANHGPNTNGSQFFITFAKQPHLDGKHVVFGRVKDQHSWAIIKEIESIEIRDQSVPVHPVEIVKCGLEDGKAEDEGLGEEEIAEEEAGRRVSEEDAAKADRPDYSRAEESSLYGNIGGYEEDEGYNDSMFDLDSEAGDIL